MRRNFLMSWVLGGLLCMAAISATAADTPLEVYGRLPSLEDVAISPDGSRIAYIRTRGEDRIVYVTSLADRKAMQALRVGTTKLRSLLWGDNDHLLIVTSSTDRPIGLAGAKSEFLMLQSFDVVSGKVVDAMRTNGKEVTLNAIAGMPMLRNVDGVQTMFVVGYAAQNRTFLPALFRYRFRDEFSQAEIVARGSHPSTRWIVDKNGVVAATEAYDEGEQQWQLSLRIDNRMTVVASGKAEIEYPTLKGFAPDGSALWLETIENDSPVWKSVALKDGAMSGVLEETKGFADLLVERQTGRVIGGRMMNANHELEFFDNHLRETWNVIEHIFAGERVTLASASDGFKKLVLLIDGPRRGLAYVQFDTDTYQVTQIGSVYDGLEQYAEVRSISYAAGDGMEIPAFVTLPPGRSPTKLPLIVLPHGGPAARDTGYFDWMAQAFASRGYAVLQANYRGSDLGWQFMSAGFGEWGRKMQTDLSDGVRALVKQGLVDPQRVCIVGASYGGYAALAGATLDTGIYRCAVSVSGISDLSALQSWIVRQHRNSDSAGLRYFDRYLGAADPKDPVVKARSPVQHVASVTIPIMLIHGKDDTIVPFEQSTLMANALKRLGKPVEMVELRKEDHWLSRSETRLQMLQATMKFLLDNNPPE